jgi:hypothetical protein
VVGVQNDGNAVDGGDGADVVSSRNSSGDGSLLVLVVDALSSEEGGSSLRSLEDDWRLGIASGLESRNDGGGRCDIYSGDGVAWR